MLKVSRKQWHTKWFITITKLWEVDYLGNNPRWYGEIPEKTDVCSYIRTCTVLPLIMVTTWSISLAVMLWAVIGFPVVYLGINAYFMIIAVILACIIGVWLIVILNKTERMKSFWSNRAECTEKKATKVISFFGIISQFIKDKHDKICSIIDIEEEKVNDKVK